jgi:predicted CopG family antitoxin
MLWKRILHRHARIAEICRIPRGHGQAMREGGGGDEAVFYGHGAALLFQPGEEACPGGRGGGVKVEDVEALDASGRLRGAGKGIAITVTLCLCGIAMKNITISMDDELYRLARIKAAEQSTSISALCKAFIIRLTGSEVAESEFQRLQREEQELRAELRARRISLNPIHNLSRDELHVRHALR